MRLFGEIGGATLEGAGSKPFVGVAVKISRKHSKSLEIIVV